jgi:chemotaxis-related protein WspD
MKPAAIQIEGCWKRIGVQGDKSCPELRQHVHCRNCPTQEQSARALLDREPPAGYLEEWTRLLAQPKALPAQTTETMVIFRIGAEWLALRARCWVEVVAGRPIRRLPHRANPILAGLVAVRGEILLCYSLLDLLGLRRADEPDASARKTAPRLMVACHENTKLAFPADEVVGLQRFPADAVKPIPATNARALPRFCHGLVLLEGANRQAGLLDDALVFRVLARESA